MPREVLHVQQVVLRLSQLLLERRLLGGHGRLRQLLPQHADALLDLEPLEELDLVVLLAEVALTLRPLVDRGLLR